MQRTIKVIGISPGTRYIGFALFCGSDLRDWGVRNIEGAWSKDKMAKIRAFLLSMIHQHGANTLCIKAVHPSRTSPNLNRLVRDVKGLAKREGLRVYEYDVNELKSFFHPEKINRRQLAEMVASKYPVLFYELNREQNIRNPYYVRMFEAVALGSVCFHQMDRCRQIKSIK